MQQSEVVLEVDQLSVNYGDVEAVRNSSLKVYSGEIVTLLGSNGAGKSTTLKAICRLVDVKDGDIKFQGKSLLELRTQDLVKRGIALVPENRRVFPALNVVQNLELGAYGKNRSYVKGMVKEMLAFFPSLAKYANKYAAGLSGGEQQMLAIARALMSEPKLLLLDEPSLGLAPILVDQVFQKLQQINKAGTTILLIEQNAQMALMVADRAYVMESGSITIDGDADKLLNDENIISAYLGVKQA